MRNTERLYHENQLELNKHDLRKLWKIMKVIIGKQSDYDINNFECLIDGSLSKDPELISEEFNNYFTEIGPKLASKMKKELTQCLTFLQTLKTACFYLILMKMRYQQ